MKTFEKIVLAYSGGLDTTVAIPWLKEKYGAQVIAFGVDVGQGEDFTSFKAKAIAAGALSASFADAVDEYAYGFILPALKANALYEGVYPLHSALSRPLIVEKLVEKAAHEGADAVAHGCTGKGNDQVRFELSLAALAPDLPVIAPARMWGFSRDDSLAYAKAKGLGFLDSKKPPYSIDSNLWGRAVECGELEDPWAAPPEGAYQDTASALLAPDVPATIVIDFVEGCPVALDGEPMSLTELIKAVAVIAGSNGVGRIDHVENRTVGIKSREVYENPAAVTLIAAHKALESLVLTKAESSFKSLVDSQWSEIAYKGLWHAPIKKALDAFIETTQQKVTGMVRLSLYKGGLAVTGRKSPWSLYDHNLATYGKGDPFDHGAADGFLKISAMELKAASRVKAHASAAAFEVHDHEQVHMAQPVA